MGNLNQTDLERSQIERALARIEDALRRCRTEDVRYGMGIAATLDFLSFARMKSGHSSSFVTRSKVSTRAIK